MKKVSILLLLFIVACGGPNEETVVQDTTITTIEDTTTTTVEDTTTNTIQDITTTTIQESIYQTIDGQKLSHVSNRFLASFDMNNDGLTDLVLGRENTLPDKKAPIKVYFNNGDGTFTDVTTSVLTSIPNVFSPIGATADFNNDGILDIAIIDQGDIERPQSSGGWIGGEPILLLSNGTKWDISNAFIDAVQNADPNYCWPSCSTTLHAKAITTGDIDNDGDIDLYIESGGGYNNPNPHFMINNGDATFSLDASDSRRSDKLIWGDSGRHRFARQKLIDINQDGYMDLVMGQLRRIDNEQENLSSMIIFNDGKGNFLFGNELKLPYVPWNDGWTYVKNIVSADINKDGLIDLILSHERGNLIPDPESLGNTGRYLQALTQQQDGSFKDETSSWFGDQSKTIVHKVNTQGLEDINVNSVSDIHYIDLNKDGENDLFFTSSQVVGSHAPLIMLFNNFQFIPVDPEEITLGNTWWGQYSYPIDLNGNGFYDFIHLNWNAGPDNFWGNEDDYSLIIPTFINN